MVEMENFNEGQIIRLKKVKSKGAIIIYDSEICRHIEQFFGDSNVTIFLEHCFCDDNVFRIVYKSNKVRKSIGNINTETAVRRTTFDIVGYDLYALNLTDIPSYIIDNIRGYLKSLKYGVLKIN